MLHKYKHENLEEMTPVELNETKYKLIHLN